jgi:hypothetical protein
VYKSTDQLLREIVENKFPDNLDDDELIASLNKAFPEYDDRDAYITFIEAGLSAYYPATIAIQMVVGEEMGVHLIEIAKLRAMIKS